MIKIFNVLLVAGVLFAASVMYALEHQTRGLERENAAIRYQIELAKENYKLLRAEWSSLTRPERLEVMAARKLDLNRVTVTQFVPARALRAVLATHRQALADMQVQPPQ
jgi:cell division protein FtsL